MNLAADPNSGGNNTAAKDEVDVMPASTVVLRLRGLPFSATEEDVRQFFGPNIEIDPSPGSVVVVTQGFHRGEGYVRFASPEVCAVAYHTMNRQNLGDRYIELYPSNVSALELQRQSQLQLMSEKRHYVRLRGLPFMAQEGNVREFLSSLGPGAVMNVHMCSGPDGRFNGNAFVELASDAALRQALATLQRQMMGTRYIEIFESSALERDAVVTAERRRRARPPVDMYNAYGAQATFSPRAAYPVVRIRGLPYTANESTIADFLRGVNIPPQGVHMVYNANERPTGEAFVEVYTEADVQASLVLNNHTLGNRYIEVFRSSQAEMLRLQMGDMPGGAPPPSLPVSQPHPESNGAPRMPPYQAYNTPQYQLPPNQQGQHYHYHQHQHQQHAVPMGYPSFQQFPMTFVAPQGSAQPASAGAGAPQYVFAMQQQQPRWGS